MHTDDQLVTGCDARSCSTNVIRGEYSRRLECLSQLVFEFTLVVYCEYSHDRNADSLVSADVLKLKRSHLYGGRQYIMADIHNNNNMITSINITFNSTSIIYII